MSEIDDKIREALEETGIDADEFGEEDSLRTLLADSFQGKLRWMTILALIYQLIFLGLAILAAVRFFDATATGDQILWASVFLGCLVLSAMVKIWNWMMINRNRVLREIKRLELEVARLGKKLGAR